MQVFARVSAQRRTLPLTLHESDTITELETKISLLLSVPKSEVRLTFQGAPLKMNLVKADSTIVVSLGGLQGGSNVSNELPSNPYAKIVMVGVGDTPDFEVAAECTVKEMRELYTNANNDL
jgi:hypothetical protein